MKFKIGDKVIGHTKHPNKACSGSCPPHCSMYKKTGVIRYLEDYGLENYGRGEYDVVFDNEGGSHCSAIMGEDIELFKVKSWKELIENGT